MTTTPEAEATMAEIEALVRGAPLKLPQKDLANASDDYLKGFQAGAIAQLDGILAALSRPAPERIVDTTKLNAGQLVQRIMRSMDSTTGPGSTAELAEQIAAGILDLPSDYWTRPAPTPADLESTILDWPCEAQFNLATRIAANIGYVLAPAPLIDRPAPAAEVTGERWWLGSMNDGLFIINRPPRPSTDEYYHDRPDGPDMVIAVSALSPSKAQQIVDAHNDALATTSPDAGRVPEGRIHTAMGAALTMLERARRGYAWPSDTLKDFDAAIYELRTALS